MENKINDGGAAFTGCVKSVEERTATKKFVTLSNGTEFQIDNYVGVERVGGIGQSGMDVNIVLSTGDKIGVRWFWNDDDAATFAHSLHGEIMKIKKEQVSVEKAKEGIRQYVKTINAHLRETGEVRRLIFRINNDPNFAKEVNSKLNRLAALEKVCRELMTDGLWPGLDEDKRDPIDQGERGFAAAAKESDRRLKAKLKKVLEEA